MRRAQTRLVTFLWLMSLVAGGTLGYGQSKLDEQLGALERLRRGLNTAFDEVERLGQQMLKEYSAAEDQGRIYYQLTHNYAQSGISIKARADKVVEYAQKGLACPLDPVRRLRLYSYWGAALKVGDQSAPLSPRRKAAAIVWLKGLKEAQQYNIPEKAPPLPPAPIMFQDNAEPVTAEMQALRRQAAENAAAAKRIREEERLFFARKVLIMELVDAYRQIPHAASELRELATSILGDHATVDLLMNRLKDIGALEDAQLPTAETPR